MYSGSESLKHTPGKKLNICNLINNFKENKIELLTLISVEIVSWKILCISRLLTLYGTDTDVTV